MMIEYLKKELSLGWIVGPIQSEVVPPNAHVSPFGVIPKSSQPGKSVDCGLIQPTVEERRIMLPAVRTTRRRDLENSASCERGTTGKTGHRECAPHDPSPPGGQALSSHSVGRTNVL